LTESCTGEDTDTHQNDVIWYHDLKDGTLTRLLSSETTSPYWYPNINGWAYMMTVVQHPYGESDEDRMCAAFMKKHNRVHMYESALMPRPNVRCLGVIADSYTCTRLARCSIVPMLAIYILLLCIRCPDTLFVRTVCGNMV
jgi:hypothetical protein